MGVYEESLNKTEIWGNKTVNIKISEHEAFV